MSTVILELDDAEILSGYITATKIDDKGRRRGLMPISDVAELLRGLVDWETAGRTVKLISRFEESPFLAWGQNGAKWVAVKTLDPAEYYLVSASGKAYKVHLPRLVVYVGNYINWPRIFWTDTDHLTPATVIYPLVIGNTYSDGRVCTGSTGLRCRTPNEIDQYIRRLIESPATHTVTDGTDELYKALEQQWAPGIGRRHGIRLERLLVDGYRG